MKPLKSEEKEDDSDPVSDDGAAGGTPPLDGGSIGRNSKAEGSGDVYHTNDWEAFLRNVPAAAGGPESDESASE